jgi:hypothetical protein
LQVTIDTSTVCWSPAAPLICNLINFNTKSQNCSYNAWPPAQTSFRQQLRFLFLLKLAYSDALASHLICPFTFNLTRSLNEHNGDVTLNLLYTRCACAPNRFQQSLIRVFFFEVIEVTTPFAMLPLRHLAYNTYLLPI